MKQIKGKDLTFESRSSIALLREKRLFMILSGAVFVYLAYRVLNLPLYFDELTTLNFYVKNGLISPFNKYAQANNHILNTLFTYLTYNLFGESSFVIRLPNLIAFFIYSFFVFKLGLLLRNVVVRWTFYLSIMLCLNLIDFFALSRGYGLSMAFMMGTCYFLYQSMNKSSARLFILTLICAALSMLANLSLLLFVLIVFLIASIPILKRWKSISKYKRNRLFIPVVGLFLVYLIFIIYTIQFYRSSELLWWGNSSSFWDATVGSQSAYLFTSKDLIKPASIGIACMAGVMAIIVFLQRSFHSIFNKNYIFFWILLGNVLGILVLSITHGVNFPYQRTGIHLTLLFLLSYPFVLDNLQGKVAKLKPILSLVLLSIPVASIIHFNTSKVLFWELDSIPKDYVSIVENTVRTADRDPSTIYVGGMGFGSWNYQVWRENLSNVPLSDFNDKKPFPFYDYIISPPKEVLEFNELYRDLTPNTSNGRHVFQRKDKLNLTSINDSIITQEKVFNNEFNDMLRCSETISDSTLLVNFKIEMKFDRFPMEGNVALSIKDSLDENVIQLKTYMLDYFVFEKSKESVTIEFSDLLTGLPTNQKLNFIVYYHNPKMHVVSILKSEVHLFSVN